MKTAFIFYDGAIPIGTVVAKDISWHNMKRLVDNFKFMNDTKTLSYADFDRFLCWLKEEYNVKFKFYEYEPIRFG